MIIPDRNGGNSSGGTSEDPRLTEMYQEIPDREVFVKNPDDSMTGTGMLLLEDNTLLAPEGFATESGSINFGDLITLSEASGFLAIQNNLNGNRYRLVDHFVPKNAPSSKPGYVHMYEAENEFITQGVSNTLLNANPLIFSYTTQLMSRVNSMKLKASSAMTNVRLKITAIGPNIVVKYFPTKASWVQGTEGVNLVAGDNVLDFKDTPLLFEPGTQLQFEIRANSISLLGNASGVPYITAMVQRGVFKYLANFEEIPTSVSQLSNDAGYLTSSTLPSIPDSTSDLTNDSGFITASQAPVQSVNGQVGTVNISIPEQVNADWNSVSGTSQILNKPSLSTVATSGSYTDLSNKPTIPTNTNQLTNGAGFVTAVQAASSAPVQSVNGQVGNVTLTIPAAQIQSDWNQSNTSALDYIKNKPTIPSVVYPVTSVNGKTGDVVLVNTDVGAAATSHTHAIADITGLQTALNGKISVGASIPYSTLTGAPALATVATSGSYADLTNKPTIPSAQVNSDWSATTGVAQVLNKPTTLSGYGITDAVTQASLTSTLGGYATTGALTGGLAGKYNNPTGTTSQYVRGDGTLATFPSIPTVPTNVSAFTNDAGYLTSISSAAITSALGYTPYNGTTNPNGYVNQAGARSSVSLTTTGTSGAATYNSTTGVLNIPNYAVNTGTVTSITAGTGLSGGTITTSGTISMPNVGTAGSYNGTVTTDAQGRVTTGTNRSYTNPTRSLNTSFQISTTQDTLVSYAVDITVAALILAGTAGRVYLEYANDTGFTSGVTTVTSAGSSTGGVLNITNVNTANLSGVIPAGKFVRLRTANVTGTPTFGFISSQEVLL